MVGIAQRQEFRRRVLFSGRPHDAAFRREHLQHDAHRPVGRRLPHRSGRVQLQPHRCRGDGVFRHVPAAALHPFGDIHDSRVSRTTLRQAVALLLFRNLHRGQHLSRCGRGAVCRRADHQVVVPGGGLAAHHHHLRRAGGFVHHSGRSFVGDQRRADPGGDSDRRVGDPDGSLLRQRRVRLPRVAVRKRRHERQTDSPADRYGHALAGADRRHAGAGHLFLGQQPDARTARVERAERRRGPQRGCSPER